jgi:hypothetical protein
VLLAFDASAQRGAALQAKEGVLSTNQDFTKISQSLVTAQTLMYVFSLAGVAKY